MKRREFIAASGLLAAPMIAPAATSEDPFLPCFRAWLRAKQDWWQASQQEVPGAYEEWESPECLEAQRREDLAFNAMMATPPATMEGIAALAQVIWNELGPGYRRDDDRYTEAAASYEFQPLLALWRAASGRDDHPPPVFPWWN